MRDSETAFENAIKNGLNAEEYMYMYSDEKVDYFKHINTRNYEKKRKNRNFNKLFKKSYKRS